MRSTVTRRSYSSMRSSSAVRLVDHRVELDLDQDAIGDEPATNTSVFAGIDAGEGLGVGPRGLRASPHSRASRSRVRTTSLRLAAELPRRRHGTFDGDQPPGRTHRPASAPAVRPGGGGAAHRDDRAARAARAYAAAASKALPSRWRARRSIHIVGRGVDADEAQRPLGVVVDEQVGDARRVVGAVARLRAGLGPRSRRPQHVHPLLARAAGRTRQPRAGSISTSASSAARVIASRYVDPSAGVQPAVGRSTTSGQPLAAAGRSVIEIP